MSSLRPGMACLERGSYIELLNFPDAVNACLQTGHPWLYGRPVWSVKANNHPPFLRYVLERLTFKFDFFFHLFFFFKIQRNIFHWDFHGKSRLNRKWMM